MAYDPNDPKDKKILEDAVKAALEEQAEEHEAAVTGLKDKNKGLLAKLAKAREGQGEDQSGEVERLENELNTTKAALKTAEKTLKTTTTQLEAITGERDGIAKNLNDTLVGKGLTDALVAANVGKDFLPAVTALLSPQVTLKQEGDERKAFVGDKSLGDFVKEWALGDQGKAYVRAPGNSGGGVGGSQGGQQTGGKSMDRASFMGMSPAEQMSFSQEGGKVTD